MQNPPSQDGSRIGYVCVTGRVLRSVSTASCDIDPEDPFPGATRNTSPGRLIADRYMADSRARTAPSTTPAAMLPTTAAMTAEIAGAAAVRLREDRKSVA